jgi:uncharacterized protein YneF (UPF0154 family)
MWPGGRGSPSRRTVNSSPGVGDPEPSSHCHDQRTMASCHMAVCHYLTDTSQRTEAECILAFRQSFSQVVVLMEIALAVLMGILAGMLASAKYLRQEIAANIGPRLTHVEQLLRTLLAESRLDSVERLRKRLDERPPED